MGRCIKRLAELLGLVVVTRAPHVTVNLLQADQVRVLSFDHLHDPIKAVAAITTADSLVNVIAQ